MESLSVNNIASHMYMHGGSPQTGEPGSVLYVEYFGTPPPKGPSVIINNWYEMWKKTIIGNFKID
jgi:hypothetical protein